MRRKNAQYLTSKLSDISEIVLPKEPENYRRIFQMYTIKASNKKTRDALKEYLDKKGIMAKIYFAPIHLTDFYKKSFGFKNGALPVTEDLSDRVLTLPMYPELTKKEIDFIAAEIKRFFKNL